jgi:hypothetical protein
LILVLISFELIFLLQDIFILNPEDKAALYFIHLAIFAPKQKLLFPYFQFIENSERAVKEYLN